MKGLCFIGGSRLVSTDHVFDVIEGFSFDVVIEPGFDPIGNIFSCTPAMYALRFYTQLQSKFFFGQSSFFQEIIKSSLIHFSPLYGYLDRKIISKIAIWIIYPLTNMAIWLYNSNSI